jgi:hypothetical protein
VPILDLRTYAHSHAALAAWYTVSDVVAEAASLASLLLCDKVCSGRPLSLLRAVVGGAFSSLTDSCPLPCRSCCLVYSQRRCGRGRIACVAVVA